MKKYKITKKGEYYRLYIRDLYFFWNLRAIRATIPEIHVVICELEKEKEEKEEIIGLL